MDDDDFDDLDVRQMLAAVYGARVASCIQQAIKRKARELDSSAAFTDETYDLIHRSGLHYAQRMRDAMQRAERKLKT